jgi:Zn-dependent peptidase ImmA (M78 family)
LGHLVLHRQLDAHFLHNDHHVIEAQAFWFAGAFLLPATTFAADVYAPTIGAFKALKPRWKVSIQAMIARARDLGFLTEDQAKSAWITLNRHGWRAKEPLDDDIPLEEPQLLKSAYDLLRKSGINCRAEILANGMCSPEDAETLLGLPEGAFGEERSKDQPMPAVRAAGVVASGRSKVVPFRPPLR